MVFIVILTVKIKIAAGMWTVGNFFRGWIFFSHDSIISTGRCLFVTIQYLWLFTVLWALFLMECFMQRLSFLGISFKGE